MRVVQGPGPCVSHGARPRLGFERALRWGLYALAVPLLAGAEYAILFEIGPLPGDLVQALHADWGTLAHLLAVPAR